MKSTKRSSGSLTKAQTKVSLKEPSSGNKPANSADKPPKKKSLNSPNQLAKQATLLKELYRQMLTIRRVEEALAKAYSQGKMGGFLHLCIGQEPACVGVVAALRPEDYVFSSYREHGHCMAKAGVSMDVCKAVLAELLGKDTGISRGYGGSMHLFDEKNRFMGGYGIVGGQVPLATGTAFASKYRNTDEVTVCFLGDGAVPQGAFHEALSLAGLWKLPVVFVIENNQYAMGTPLSRTVAVTDLTERASGYGIARDRFYGNDVLLVKERIEQAVARARKEKMPTLVEIITYRYRGHSISDPGTYRTKEEVEEWRKKDGILIAREQLLKVYKEAEIDALDEQIKSDVQEAVTFAEQSPPANPAGLWKYIYATESTNPQAM